MVFISYIKHATIFNFPIFSNYIIPIMIFLWHLFFFLLKQSTGMIVIDKQTSSLLSIKGRDISVIGERHIALYVLVAKLMQWVLFLVAEG